MSVGCKERVAEMYECVFRTHLEEEIYKKKASEMNGRKKKTESETRATTVAL